MNHKYTKKKVLYTIGELHYGKNHMNLIITDYMNKKRKKFTISTLKIELVLIWTSRKKIIPGNPYKLLK